MNFIYHDLIINYEVIGKGKPIIILHGWNVDISIYEDIVKLLSKDYQVYLIDLPGFGKSMTPSIPYTLDDYVYFLDSFLLENKINNPILIGHSFGGRIAIRYANKYKVDKLILISSAGIRRFNFKTQYKIYTYKLKKKYYTLTKNISKLERLINNSGSTDYKCLNNVMKKTMSNIVNTNQVKELKGINSTTLLMWGKNDLETPYKNALIMNKKIDNSGLVTFNNSGHFPFLDEKYAFLRVLSSFLKIGEDK